MKYVTLTEMCETIRHNLWKIPHDIDFVIGTPRSGMIAASIIASYLNVPLTDVQSFTNGFSPQGGKRLTYFNNSHHKTGKVLVVDDTVYSGIQMHETKEKLEESSQDGFSFIYMCVYLEGFASETIDIYLEDLSQYTDNFTDIVLYEWNILQHHDRRMQTYLFDIDGVLCMDPPDERNSEEYLAYIKDAIPMFIPMMRIGGLITYRLEKNREITKAWLKKWNIRYSELKMFPAMSWDSRHCSGISPEKFKADFYSSHISYKLFVESNDIQAQRIFLLTKKPVYCTESNKMYCC